MSSAVMNHDDDVMKTVLVDDQSTMHFTFSRSRADPDDVAYMALQKRA
jgi:hypothetical protein